MKYLYLLPLVALSGCGLLEYAQSPEGQQQMQELGNQAIETAGHAASGNWTAAIASAAGAIGTTLAIIRAWRGSTKNRKGNPPAPKA